MTDDITDVQVEVALVTWFGRDDWRGIFCHEVEHKKRMRAALAAAKAAPVVDENTLPMELLPEGWHFELLRRQTKAITPGVFADEWKVMIQWWEQTKVGTGPTPRAAMIAAIEKATG